MVKVAQVGSGYWGKNLVRNFAQIDVLAAIVEPNETQAAKLSNEHGVPVKTFDEVLRDDTIDGISFATPAETHADLARRSIDAGKHVFMEKPLALSVTDAEDVIAKAKSANRHVMVGHLLQYHPIFIHARKMINENAIGKIRHIYSNRMSLGKFRLEENVWWSFAPHDLSMVLSIAGEEPHTIEAQGGSYLTPGLADWVTAQLKFPSGIGAHFNISWLHPFKEQRLTVIGDDGMLVFEDSAAQWEQKLVLYRHKVTTNRDLAPVPQKADPEYVIVEKGEPLKNECQHFVDCIRDNVVPRTDGAEGLAVLRVLQKGEAKLEQFLKTQPARQTNNV